MMTQSQINATFLKSLDTATRSQIIDAIASHYGITVAEVMEEVTGSEAESILDYLTGQTRAAASLLMKRHGIRSNAA